MLQKKNEYQIIQQTSEIKYSQNFKGKCEKYYRFNNTENNTRFVANTQTSPIYRTIEDGKYENKIENGEGSV